MDDDNIQTAKEILELAQTLGKKIILPVDCVAAKEIDKRARSKTKTFDKLPDGYMGLDIGPKTIRLFKKELKRARTVIWNGPMGVFEIPKFENGTKKLALTLPKVRGTVIVGGGDSALAAKHYGINKLVTHVSTGGGATLKLLEGSVLPCVDVISDVEGK